MPSIPGNATITNAKLISNLFSGTYSWGALEIYRLNSAWNSYTVTWNNHSSISKTYLHGGITPTYSSPYYKYNINVTSTVADWYANGLSNNWGFMLKYQDENYNDYNWLYSSDSTVSSTYKPAIVITYETQPLANYQQYGWILPVVGYTHITTGGGYKVYVGHNGIDISGSGIYGKPIRAVQSGKVVWKSDYHSSAGNWIVIETNDIDFNTGKKIRYGYMHMQSPALYSIGQTISQGTVVGYVGNTGYVLPQPTPEEPYKGAHLHFEVIKDSTGTSYSVSNYPESAVNPTFFYPAGTFTGQVTNYE